MYKRQLQASPLSAFTVPQKGPIYTTPINTGASRSKEETTAYAAKPHEHPSSVHSSSYPSSATTSAVTYTAPDQVWCLPPSPPQGCSTSLSVKDNTFQDIVEIQRKQTELSQTIVNQQARSLLPSNEPPMFYGDAMEYPLFMTAFESLIESKVEDSNERLYFLGQYTSGKAKEIINGCLQRKMEGSYEEAKRLLRRQFGDAFKIANDHITRLSSWPPIRPREIVYSGESDPYAVRSLLGWNINGPLYTPCQSSILTCNRIHLNQQDTSSPRGYVVSQRTVKEQITPQAVERMFELDFSEKEKGISMSREDIKFYETVETGVVHLEDLHYEMPLPFKHKNTQLPNNYAQAEKRLNSLKKRLMSDDKYYTDYCSFMSDIISKGYARKVDDDLKDQLGRTWYLPHHGIYHPQKPTKIRVVFDCSASFEGHSLNDKLLQGPDLSSNLVGVLTRFRQKSLLLWQTLKKCSFK